jgi:hypothetical protein
MKRKMERETKRERIDFVEFLERKNALFFNF